MLPRTVRPEIERLHCLLAPSACWLATSLLACFTTFQLAAKLPHACVSSPMPLLLSAPCPPCFLDLFLKGVAPESVLIGSEENPDPLAAMRGPWAPCSHCTFRGGLYLGSDARPGCMCINGVWIGIRPLAGFVPVLSKEVQATVG